MRTADTFEFDDRKSVIRLLVIFFWAFCVVGTTMLNLAFSLMPQVMTQLVRHLMA